MMILDFQLALSSDKLATLQEPLLQLDLDVRDANGEKKEVFLELNKAELAKLITSLEGCSKVSFNLYISVKSTQGLIS